MSGAAGDASGVGTPLDRAAIRQPVAFRLVFDATPLTAFALRPGDSSSVTPRRDAASGIAAVIDVIPPTD